MTYVAPARRTTVQQPVISENIVANPERVVEPAIEAENVENSEEKAVENVSVADKIGDTVANPVPAVHKPVVQKISFPERLEKTKEEKQYAKFLETMKEVQITIPIFDAVLHIPLYAKFFKDLITKKRSLEDPEIVALTEHWRAIIRNYMPKKLGDPGSFSIPCVVGKRIFTALCDLGSSVSVLPLAVSQILQLGALKPTSMTLQLADRTLRKPVGILEDVPVQVGNFAYPVDFVVLEMEDNSESMILGRPFLATARAIIDVKGGTLKLQFGSKEAEFSMKHASHMPHILEQCHSIDVVDKSVMNTLQEMQSDEPEAQAFVTADSVNPLELCGINIYEEKSSRGKNPHEGSPLEGKIRGSRQ